MFELVLADFAKLTALLYPLVVRRIETTLSDLAARLRALCTRTASSKRERLISFNAATSMSFTANSINRRHPAMTFYPCCRINGQPYMSAKNARQRVDVIKLGPGPARGTSMKNPLRERLPAELQSRVDELLANDHKLPAICDPRHARPAASRTRRVHGPAR